VGITSVLNLRETLPPTATGSPRAQRRRGCGGRPAQYMSPRQRRASPRSLSDGTSQEVVVVRYRDDHEAVTKVSTLASNHSEPPSTTTEELAGSGVVVPFGSTSNS
jgi:hypothetical protein